MMDYVDRVANHVKSLMSSGRLRPEPPEITSHMGATITDSVFQAGMQYSTVKDWVSWVRSQDEGKTASGFLRLLNKNPRSYYGKRYNRDMAWGRKADLVKEVTSTFVQDGVETEYDLRTWLETAENANRLGQLRGIGRKTINYFRILSGDPNAVAIDIRLRSFLRRILGRGIADREAERILVQTAERLGLLPASLDHGIWRYMEGENSGNRRVGSRKRKG